MSVWVCVGVVVVFVLGVVGGEGVGRVERGGGWEGEGEHPNSYIVL